MPQAHPTTDDAAARAALEAEREMARLKRKGGGDAHAAGASSNG